MNRFLAALLLSVLLLRGASAQQEWNYTPPPGGSIFTGPALGLGLSNSSGSCNGTPLASGGTLYLKSCATGPITATTYTVQNTDISGYIVFTGSSASVFTLPTAGSAGFENGNSFSIYNAGTKNITASSISTINPAGITILPGAWATFTSDTTINGTVNCSISPYCWDANITYTPSVLSVAAVGWDSNTTVVGGTTPIMVPQWAGGGTITSVTYYTGGSSTPSFTADVQIAGSSMTGCNAISVSSATSATATCTGSNTFSAGQKITLITSSVSGAPNGALVQINFTHTLQ